VLKLILLQSAAAAVHLEARPACCVTTNNRMKRDGVLLACTPVRNPYIQACLPLDFRSCESKLYGACDLHADGVGCVVCAKPPLLCALKRVYGEWCALRALCCHRMQSVLAVLSCCADKITVLRSNSMLFCTAGLLYIAVGYYLSARVVWVWAITRVRCGER
jgi:hypothetical protein